MGTLETRIDFNSRNSEVIEETIEFSSFISQRILGPLAKHQIQRVLRPHNAPNDIQITNRNMPLKSDVINIF